jgi:hypothetical protein
MHVVAIARLATSIEDEAKALAAELGTLAYEQRLKLNAGVPAIVLSTPDDARATAMFDGLRRRGHDAMRCRYEDVVALADMTELRRFRVDGGGLIASDSPAAPRLEWADLAVIVRAIHRTTAETTELVSEKQLSLGRAALTGGLIMNRTTTKQVSSQRDDTEAVLYLFPRTGRMPWCVREQRTQYGALGDDVTPSSSQNFARVVELLRTRARQAAYDDRLVARKAPAADIDVLAHLVAGLVSAGALSPFR